MSKQRKAQKVRLAGYWYDLADYASLEELLVELNGIEDEDRASQAELDARAAYGQVWNSKTATWELSR